MFNPEKFSEPSLLNQSDSVSLPRKSESFKRQIRNRGSEQPDYIANDSIFNMVSNEEIESVRPPHPENVEKTKDEEKKDYYGKNSLDTSTKRK